VKIAMGSDHGGFLLKESIKTYLSKQGYEIIDMGTHNLDSTDYPIYGRLAAEQVANGTCERGIVICSTGVGISITANKVKGIRAALCTDVFTAKLTREHNDANVLALGQYVVGEMLAYSIVDIWLGTAFSDGERHIRRIAEIAEMEDN